MCCRLDMGVPDDMEGPPRKKCKLSLQSKRREQNERPTYSHAEEHSTKPPSEIKEIQPSSGTSFVDRPRAEDSQNSIAKSPAAPEMPVPPVATLHNLGNTCFLNCILQILRYTPNFLPGLASLKDKIQALEDTLDKMENADEFLTHETRRTWRIVKDIHQMYQRMNGKEAAYSKTQASQSSHMAVRPSTVLNSMRELNPMFEGNFQHDAQELLRCLLCYLEDAERGVVKIRDKILTKEGTGLESLDKNLTTISSPTQQTVNGRASSDASDKEEDKGKRNEVVAPCTEREGPKKPFKLKGGAPSNRTSHRKKGSAKLFGVERGDGDGENREVNKCPLVFTMKQTNGVEERKDNGNVVNKLARGLKRKRSKGDGGDADKAVGRTKEKVEAKPDSPELTNGVTTTRKKIQGNSQTIVGFLKKVKDKLLPNPSRVTEQEVLNKAEKKNIKEASSFNLSRTAYTAGLHLKPKKRLGMTRLVIQQDHTLKESSDCILIDDAVQGDLPQRNNCQTSRDGEQNGNGQLLIHPLKADSQSASKCHTALRPVCGIPLTSADEEITPTLDNDLPFDMENTIDSVTKKYYSSLPRKDFNLEPPSISPKISQKNHENADSEWKAKEDSPDSYRGKPPSCGVHSLTPGKDLIIHSPSKSVSGYTDNHSISLSKAKKALDFELVGNSFIPSPTSSPIANSQAFGNDVNFLDFLPRRARQISESHSIKELKDNLSNLDVSGMTTRSIRSAPNTPDGSSTAGKYKKLAIDRDFFGSGSHSKERDCAQVKIKLRRCDWLGVSPVKSVSAASALRNLRSEGRKPSSFTSTSRASGAKRNIVQDLDLLGSRDQISSCQQFNKASSPDVAACYDGLETNKLKGFTACKEKMLINSGGYDDKSSIQTDKEKISSIMNSNANVKMDSSQLDSSAKEASNNLHVARVGATSFHSSSLQQQIQGDSFKRFKDVHCPSGLKLKKLSVSLGKCDWMLERSPSSSISDRSNRMVNGKVRRLRSKRNGHSSVRLYSSPTHTQHKVETESTRLDLPLIERLFGGTMVHVTRCLECERGRERKESFLDISIAVQHLKEASPDDSLGEEEEDASPSLCLASLIGSSLRVERLRDSNKYWCEECLHHVEAERSCHYMDLPQILSLHLKRFSTNSGLFGGLSKLNDKVDIPDELPCLKHKCSDSCKDPSHSYQLFAIATHSGLSILHGHYRAFVKVQPSVNPQVFHNLVSYQNGSSNSFSHSAASWASETCSSSYTSPGCSQALTCLNPQRDNEFGSKQSAQDSVMLENGESEKDVQCPPLSSSSSSFIHPPPTASNSYDKVMKEGNLFPSRRITDFFASAELKTKTKSSVIGTDSLDTTSTKSLASETADTNVSPLNNARNSQPIKTENHCDLPYWGNPTEETSSVVKEELTDVKCPRCYWLECDDECVRVMGEEEFSQKLKEEDGALLGTPYLLFYHSKIIQSSKHCVENNLL